MATKPARRARKEARAIRAVRLGVYVEEWEEVGARKLSGGRGAQRTYDGTVHYVTSHRSLMMHSGALFIQVFLTGSDLLDNTLSDRVAMVVYDRVFRCIITYR